MNKLQQALKSETKTKLGFTSICQNFPVIACTTNEHTQQNKRDPSNNFKKVGYYELKLAAQAQMRVGESSNALEQSPTSNEKTDSSQPVSVCLRKHQWGKCPENTTAGII